MALNQKERDWLQWLHQAKRKQITQREAAQRMQVSERWVRQLLRRMKRQQDRVECALAIRHKRLPTCIQATLRRIITVAL